MSAYSIALFLHLVGVLTLFAGVGLEQTGLHQLRNAASLTQIREWMLLLRRLRRFDGPAALVILVSGAYMAMHGAGRHAWVAAGIIGMVLMAALGAGVGRPRFIAIGKALPVTDGAISRTLRERLHDPILRASAATRAALGLAIVFVMAVKPAAATVLVVFAIALGIGAVTAIRGVGAGRALAGSE